MDEEKRGQPKILFIFGAQAQKKHDQDSAIDVDHVVINRISYMVFMLLFIAICNFGIKSKTNKFNLLERNGYESNL